MLDEQPAAPKTKVCKLCRERKPFDTLNWRTQWGQPSGALCRPCYATGDQKGKENRRAAAKKARATGMVSLADESIKGKKKKYVSSWGKKPGELGYKQLELAHALKAGASLLNTKAHEILQKLADYAEDATSPHHEWVLKLLAERILPKKVFEELGVQAMGLNPSVPGGARPIINIMVNPAVVPVHDAVADIVDATVIERSEHEKT